MARKTKRQQEEEQKRQEQQARINNLVANIRKNVTSAANGDEDAPWRQDLTDDYRLRAVRNYDNQANYLGRDTYSQGMSNRRASQTRANTASYQSSGAPGYEEWLDKNFIGPRTNGNVTTPNVFDLMDKYQTKNQQTQTQPTVSAPYTSAGSAAGKNFVQRAAEAGTAAYKRWENLWNNWDRGDEGFVLTDEDLKRKRAERGDPFPYAEPVPWPARRDNSGTKPVQWPTDIQNSIKKQAIIDYLNIMDKARKKRQLETMAEQDPNVINAPNRVTGPLPGGDMQDPNVINAPYRVTGPVHSGGMQDPNVINAPQMIGPNGQKLGTGAKAQAGGRITTPAGGGITKPAGAGMAADPVAALRNIGAGNAGMTAKALRGNTPGLNAGGSAASMKPVGIKQDTRLNAGANAEAVLRGSGRATGLNAAGITPDLNAGGMKQGAAGSRSAAAPEVMSRDEVKQLAQTWQDDMKQRAAQKISAQEDALADMGGVPRYMSRRPTDKIQDTKYLKAYDEKKKLLDEYMDTMTMDEAKAIANAKPEELGQIREQMQARREYPEIVNPKKGENGQYQIVTPEEARRAREIENKFIETGMFDNGTDPTKWSTGKLQQEMNRLNAEVQRTGRLAAQYGTEGTDRENNTLGVFRNLYSAGIGTDADWDEKYPGSEKSIDETVYDMMHGAGSFAAIFGKAAEGTKRPEDLIPYGLQAARENNGMFRTGIAALDGIPHDGTQEEIDAYRSAMSRIGGDAGQLWEMIRGNVNNMDDVIAAVQKDQYAAEDDAYAELDEIREAYAGAGNEYDAYENLRGSRYEEISSAAMGYRTGNEKTLDKYQKILDNRAEISRLEGLATGEAGEENIEYSGLMQYMTDDEREKYDRMGPEEKKQYLAALDSSLKTADKWHGDSVSRSFASHPVWGGAASLASIGTNMAAGLVAPVRLAAYAFGDESAAEANSSWGGLQNLTDIYRNTRAEMVGQTTKDFLKWMANGAVSLAGDVGLMNKKDAEAFRPIAEKLMGSMDADVDKVTNFLYQTAMSIADNLAAMGVAGAATGGKLNTTLGRSIIQFIMSSEATSNAFQRAIVSGKDPTEAALVSIGNGIVEAVTEYWSLDKLLGGLTGVNKKALTKYLWTSAGIEGSEEFFADVLNTGLDWVASRIAGHETELEDRAGQIYTQLKTDPNNAGKSEKELRDMAKRQTIGEWWAQAGASFAGGVLSGFALSKIYSGTMGRYAEVYNRAGENVSNMSAEDIRSILDEAGGMIGDGKGLNRTEVGLRNALEKANTEFKQNGKLSAENAANLIFNIEQTAGQRGGKGGQIGSEAYRQAVAGAARAAIVNNLNENGETAEGQKINAAAEAVAAYMRKDGKISAAQRAAISSVPGAMDVAEQMRTNKLSGDVRQAEAIRQATGEAIRADARTQQERAAVSAKTTVNDLLNKQFRQEVANKAISDPQIASEDDFRAAKGERTNSHVEAVAGDVIGDIMRAEKGKLIVRAQDGTETKVDPWDVKAAEGVMGQAAKWMSMERGALSDTLMNDIITMVRDGTMNERNSGQILLDSYMVHVAGYAKAAMPKTDLDPKIAQAVYDTAREEAVRDAEELAKRPLKPLRPNEGEVTIKLDGETVNREDKKAWKAELGKISDLAQRQRVSFYADLMHRMGLDLEIVDDKSRPDIYGSYQNGKIMLNIAGTEGKAENQRAHHIGVALSHEVTHFMKKYSGESYEQLKNFVIDTLEKQGVSVNNLVAHKMDQYKGDAAVNEDGTPAKLMSVEGALDEVIADACGEMLGQEEFVNSLKQNQTLYEKVRGYVQNFVRRWQAAARGMSQSLSAEAQLMHGNVKELARLWNVSLNESLEKAYQSKNENQTDLIGPETDSLPEQKEFAMQSFAERVAVEGNELVAIHNLKARDILADLKMNGFPSPSIAVVQAKNGWGQYGDISVIFDRYTVDPKMNPKARLYGGDAFTPTLGNFNTEGNAQRALEHLRSKPEREMGVALSKYTVPSFQKLYDIEQVRRMHADENHQDPAGRGKMLLAANEIENELHRHWQDFVLADEISFYDMNEAGVRTLVQMLDTLNSDEAADLNEMDDEDLAWNFNLMLQDNLRDLGRKAEYYQAEVFNQDNVKTLRNYLKKAQLAYTDMSESKPDEIVGFDHVKLVMVPTDVSQDVIDALEDAGVNYKTYERGGLFGEKRTAALNEWLNEYSREVHAPEEAVLFSRARKDVNTDDWKTYRTVDGKMMMKDQRGNSTELTGLDREYVEAWQRADFGRMEEILADKIRQNGAIPFKTPNTYNSPDHRWISQNIKKGDMYAIQRAAAEMAEMVPENAVLVPMPNHHGIVDENTDTKILAEEIAKITGSPVVNALAGIERESRKENKQKPKSQQMKAADLGFRQVMEIPEGKVPYIVDNVVASGLTAQAAHEALGNNGVTLAYAKSTLSANDGLKRANVTFYDTNKQYGQYLIPLSERIDMEKTGYEGVKFSRAERNQAYDQAVKDKDTATYDSDGKSVPLEERFDHTNNDIRYSIKDKNGEDIFSEDYLESNKKTVANMDPVITLKGNPFSKNKTMDFRTMATNYFKQIGGYADSPIFGKVNLGEQGINHLIRFITSRRSALLPAIKPVIEKGHVIQTEENHHGHGFDTAVIAAPVELDGKPYYMGVAIKQNMSENEYYMHDAVFVEMKNEKEVVPSTRAALADNGTTTNGTTSLSLAIILADLNNYNVKFGNSEGTSNNSSDAQLSRADMDADVNEFMMGLNPEDLNSAAERKLLKDYKSRAAAVRATEDRIRGMNDQLKEATGDEERKLTINLQTEWAKLDRQRQELYDITDGEGYAGMMYRFQRIMRDYMSGRTADQVRMSAREAGQAAEEAQKNAAKLAEELKGLAAQQDVQAVTSIFRKNDLKARADALIRATQSSLTSEEVQADLARIALKRAMKQNAREELEALAGKLNLNQVGIRNTEAISALEEMRGMEIGLDDQQWGDLKSAGWDAAKIRRTLAGTGITMRHGGRYLDIQGAQLKEIEKAAPGRIDVTSTDWPGQLLKLAEDAKQTHQEYDEAQRMSEDAILSTIEVISDTLAGITPTIPKDPAVAEQIRQLMSYNQRLSRSAREAAGGMESVNRMLEDIRRRNAAAAGAESIMNRDVTRAIEYYSKMSDLAHERSNAAEMEQLRRTLESQGAQRVMEEQARWRNKLETNERVRDMAEKNEKAKRQVNTVVGRLNDRIINETDIKNVPESVKGIARAMVGMFVRNDTGGGRRFGTADTKTLNEWRKIYDALDQRDGTDLSFDWVSEEDREDVQEAVEKALQDIRDGLGFWQSSKGRSEANVQGMKNALGRIQRGVNQIYEIIRSQTEIEINGRKQDVAELAYEAETEAEKREPFREYEGKLGRTAGAAIRFAYWGNMTPQYFFKRLANNALSLLHGDMKNGEHRTGLLQHEYKEKFAGLAEKQGFAKYDTDEKRTFTLKNGDTVTLTTGQMMSLYALWNREQTLGPEWSNHILGGGIVPGEIREDKLWVRKRAEERPHRVDAADVMTILNSLTGEQKALVDDVVHVLSTDGSRLGNEASMKMYGIKKYNETYYFPFNTWDGVKNKNSNAGGALTSPTAQNALKQSSFSKRRIRNAATPLVLDDFMYTAVKHMNSMITYSTMVNAVENFNKVLNFRLNTSAVEGQTRLDNPVTRNVEALLRERYGKNAVDYLRTWMQDINKGIKPDTRKSLQEYLLGLFRKNAVAGSLSVALQQPLSYIRAANGIDTKYLLAAMNPATFKGSYKEMMAHSGVAVIKDMGRFDVNYGQTGTEYMMPDGYRKVGTKVREGIEEYSTILPQWMDAITWTRMWTACKLEQQALNPDADPKSDEFLDHVAERFNELMRDTQVYDSLMVRSANMRSPSFPMKTLTSFMAEPTLTANLITDSFRTVKAKGGKKRLAEALATYLISAVAQAAIKAGMGAGRTPDEKKTFAENFAYKFAYNAISELNPFTMIPGYDELVTALSGSDINDDAYSVLKKLRDAAVQLPGMFDKSGEELYRGVEDSAGQIAQLFTDVPVKNIMRDLRAMYNYFKGGTYADRETSWPVIKYQAIDTVAKQNLFGMINKYLKDAGAGGYDTTNEAYYGRIYQAMRDGRTQDAEEMAEYLELGKGVKPETVGSKIGTAARKDADASAAETADFLISSGMMGDADYINDSYVSGEMTSAEYGEAWRRMYPGKSEDDLYWQIDKLDYRKEHGGDEGYSKYLGLREAIGNNKVDEIRAAVKTMTAHGTTQENIRTQITKDYKDAYLNATGSEKVRLRDALVKAYRAAGLTDDEANKKINAWKK